MGSAKPLELREAGGGALKRFSRTGACAGRAGLAWLIVGVVSLCRGDWRTADATNLVTRRLLLLIERHPLVK